MNPKPLSLLNHFTVPVAISVVPPTLRAADAEVAIKQRSTSADTGCARTRHWSRPEQEIIAERTYASSRLSGAPFRTPPFSRDSAGCAGVPANRSAIPGRCRHDRRAFLHLFADMR